MDINFFRQDALAHLSNKIDNNLEYYREKDTPWAEDYLLDHDFKKPVFDVNITMPDIVLKKGGSENDIENSIALFEALNGKISRVQATDRRLWTYFTHVSFWEYMLDRWPSVNPFGSESGTINDRYFVKRGVFRNGISRLYWAAALTYDKDNDEDHYELTRVLLSKQDLFNQMDRGFTKNPKVLRPFLKVLEDNPGMGEDRIRSYFAKVRQMGGVTVLDALSEDRASDLFKHIIDVVMNERYVENGDKVVLQYKNATTRVQVTIKGGKAFLGKQQLKTSPQDLSRLTIGKEIRLNKNNIVIIVSIEK